MNHPRLPSGYLKSWDAVVYRLDMNHPPTAVGGIPDSVTLTSYPAEKTEQHCYRECRASALRSETVLTRSLQSLVQ